MKREREKRGEEERRGEVEHLRNRWRRNSFCLEPVSLTGRAGGVRRLVFQSEGGSLDRQQERKSLYRFSAKQQINLVYR